jgi:hypothetical protein
MTERFFIPQPAPAGTTEYTFDSRTETLPAYRDADGGTLIWATREAMPLPAIGDKVTVTMNSIGPATVVGYFASDAFLGVMTKAIAPPAWLRRQTKRAERDAPQWVKDGIGCEFAGEIRPYVKGDLTRHRARLKEINARTGMLR